MMPDCRSRSELERLVDELRTFVPRLKRHNQALARQLIEMAIIEIRTHIYQIDDRELQALTSSMAQHEADLQARLDRIDPLPIGDGAEALRRARALSGATADVVRCSKQKR